jgi:hypothetical protein
VGANAWRQCFLQLCCFNQFAISRQIRGNFAMKRRRGAEGSNPLCSTPQSPRFRTSRRIAQNLRVCALFAHMCGPGESLCRPELAESGESYPGAILLGPRIIAIDSPADLPAQNLARTYPPSAISRDLIQSAGTGETGRKPKSEKLVCRCCGSDDLAPSFIKRRDRRCLKCFSKRYGSPTRAKKTKLKK